MKSIKLILSLSIGATYGLVLAPAMAQNTNYAPGDLVLYFQKEGDTNTVYANLGNAATIYRGSAAGPGAANKINFLDLNSTLTSAFGAGWASDTSIYAGLAAVWGTSSTSLTLQDGDPQRTLYVSMARTDVGTIGQASSAGWDLSLAGDTAMTSGAVNIKSQNDVLETAYTDAVVVSPSSISNIDNQNPFLTLGVQGVAFNTFSGGVQQQGTSGTFGSFGAAGTVEFALDLYRILSRDTVSGQVAGTKRLGSYEGTISISTSGMVSFISQGTTTSPYSAWLSTFPSISTPAAQLASADPDNDGLSNLMEFILNGNPSTSDSPSIAPALNASSTDFVFSFNRRDDSESGTTLVFQYGSDLTGWTDATIGASSSVTGNATISVTENSTDPDNIVIVVPKTVGTGGKLFGRLRATQP